METSEIGRALFAFVGAAVFLFLVFEFVAIPIAGEQIRQFAPYQMVQSILVYAGIGGILVGLFVVVVAWQIGLDALR